MMERDGTRKYAFLFGHNIGKEKRKGLLGDDIAC
jgi:hypothetical protein